MSYCVITQLSEIFFPQISQKNSADFGNRPLLINPTERLARSEAQRNEDYKRGRDESTHEKQTVHFQKKTVIPTGASRSAEIYPDRFLDFAVLRSK